MAGPSYRFGPFLVDRLRYRVLRDDAVLPFTPKLLNLLLDHCTAVVTGEPDAAKGERLVAFYTDPEITPQQLWDRLCKTELPSLWLPKRDDLHVVDAIPTLGTGKIDLRGVRQLALDRMTPVA